VPGATTEDVGAALEHLVPLLRRAAPADGLSLTAAATLARLVRTGPQRISDLAAAEGVTQPAMSQLVARLERAGLLRRERARDDARASLSYATTAGERAVAERRAQRTRVIAALVDRLPERDRTALAAAAPALRRVADLAADLSLSDPDSSDYPLSRGRSPRERTDREL